jgi:membrane-associated phospholipid phosphatase
MLRRIRYAPVVRRERLAFAAGQALVMAVVTIIVAVIYGLPLRDPDGVFGPTYVRFPILLTIVFAADVMPRVLFRTRTRLRLVPQTTVDVVKERWTFDHVRFALLGLGSWYLSYVAFRNLKSFVPFVNDNLEDDKLAQIDRWLFLGHDPAVVLHHLLGTGIAAHILSAVYVAWLGFIPFTIAAALVFSRNVLGGAWFVTAMAIDWALGVATIMAFPSLGPIYDRPDLFSDLPHTWVTSLQQTMIGERAEVLADPWATHITQNIGAFASLHVGMMVTVCLIAHFLRLNRILRIVLWTFLGLTVIATVYLGWHYFVDSIGGFAIGAIGVWVAAKVTNTDVKSFRKDKEKAGAPSAAGSRRLDRAA